MVVLPPSPQPKEEVVAHYRAPRVLSVGFVCESHASPHASRRPQLALAPPCVFVGRRRLNDGTTRPQTRNWVKQKNIKPNVLFSLQGLDGLITWERVSKELGRRRPTSHR